MANKKSDYPKPMPLLTMVFWTGLFGGILWTLIGYLAYTFNFSEVPPYVILDLFALGSVKHQWSGTILTYILYGVISLAVAYIYYWLLKRFEGIWFGVGYGLVLFLIVFFLLNPFIPGMKSLFDLERNTIITTICIYILYGMFIGYSISYEYHLKNSLNKEAAS